MSRLEEERLQISGASKGIMVYAKFGKETEVDRLIRVSILIN